MSKLKKNLILLIALVVVAAGPLFGQTIPPAGSEGKLIAVLQSNASHKEKADACRHLAIIGTKKAVAPLVALLGDEKLSHMARYGLEPIPDPAVDEAFRDALGKLKGRPLVGVIGSIGVRQDAQAVRPLSGLLRNSDAVVARAAARALGDIGNQRAARALRRALENVSATNQLAFCEGLFRCAESLAAEGQHNEAIEIYDQLRKMDDAAHQVRGGALRGAIVTRRRDGVTLLREYLQSKDYIMFSAAVQAAQEMKGRDVTKALTDGLEGLGADNQILIILTLGKRGDASALPTLSALAKSGDKSVRIAAIKALPDIGDVSSAPVLVGLLSDGDNEISKAAQEALAALPGREVDAAVMAMLESSETSERLTALDLIKRRRITNVAGALLKATKDKDESVRTASIRMLGDLAGEVEFEVLVGLLFEAKSPAEIRAAERALSTTCLREAKPSAGKVTIRKAVYRGIDGARSADVTKKVAEIVKSGSLSIEASNSNFGDAAPGIVKELRVEFTVNGVTQTKTVREGETITLGGSEIPEALVEELCSALTRVPIQQKLALLRVLSVVDGPDALKAVRASVDDSNADVHRAAIRALGAWKSTDAAPHLLELAKKATNQNEKTLCLRGYLGFASRPDLPVGQRLSMCREAEGLLERDDEKRLLLGALGNINTPGAVAMIVPYLDSSGTREEASAAIVGIAERLLKGRGASRVASRLVKPLEKVAQVTTNANVSRKAKELLKQAQEKAR
ncbi:MAG: HEAT repeat domain-containing protein [Planctomycetota bacterium]|jgi:HEAT repeat protein